MAVFVTLSDCKLFSACLHEAKPLTLRRVAIDNLPRFGVNPVNVTKPSGLFAWVKFVVLKIACARSRRRSVARPGMR